MNILRQQLLDEINGFPGGAKEIVTGLNTCIDISDGEQKHYFSTLKLDFIALVMKDDIAIEREAILFKYNSDKAVEYLKNVIDSHDCKICAFLLKLKKMEIDYIKDGVVKL